LKPVGFRLSSSRLLSVRLTPSLDYLQEKAVVEWGGNLIGSNEKMPFLDDKQF